MHDPLRSGVLPGEDPVTRRVRRDDLGRRAAESAHDLDPLVDGRAEVWLDVREDRLPIGARAQAGGEG